MKVVMLTALAQEYDRKKAEEVGAAFCFTKPFSPTALMEKVDELLAASQGPDRDSVVVGWHRRRHANRTLFSHFPCPLLESAAVPLTLPEAIAPAGRP